MSEMTANIHEKMPIKKKLLEDWHLKQFDDYVKKQIKWKKDQKKKAKLAEQK